MANSWLDPLPPGCAVRACGAERQTHARRGLGNPKVVS